MRKTGFLLLLCGLLFGASVKLCAQTITTTSNSASVELSQSGLTKDNIKIFQDTLIFEENFDKFVSANYPLGTTLFNTDSLTTIPNSLTQMSGCRAKKIQILGDTTSCYLDGMFASPVLNIPSGSKLTFQLKTSRKSNVGINEATITQNKGLKNVEYTFTSAATELKISKTDYNVYIDNIKIISTRQFLEEENYDIADGVLEINNLSPNTKYYIEITDNQNGVSEIYSAETKNRIGNLNTQITDSNSVNLSWEDHDANTTKTLHLYKVENAVNDLIFSRLATESESDTYGLELFNGTGKDICLGNYEVFFVDKGFYNSANAHNIHYRFSQEDTIRSGSYLTLYYFLNDLSSCNYPCFPIRYGTSLFGGDDACVLLKDRTDGDNKDTIDVLSRCVPYGDSTGMDYKDKILTRKPTIVSGVRHNPQNANNLWSEWDSVPYSAENLNSETTKHRLEPAVTTSLVWSMELAAGQNEILLTDLLPHTKYRAEIAADNNETLASIGFSTGNTVQTICSGSWNETATWQGGTLPASSDKVIIQKGDRLTVPEGTSASCGELVLQSDYSTPLADINKAELDLKGTLTADRITVQPSFKGYTSETDGWTLFGVPIDVTNVSRSETGTSFDRGAEDDLYYLDEEKYAWIPYFEDLEDENFFTNSCGYLVAYSQDKTLSFSGNLFSENSIALLNNASFTSEGGKGYHLVCNPYPFSVSLGNFTSNAVEGFWLLDPATGGYSALDNNEPYVRTIPPFGGFMTKVSSSNNSLVLHKSPPTQTSPAKISQNPKSVKFNLSYEGGNDQLKIYFRKDAELEYDNYDTYKLFSIGTAPDLSCRLEEMDLSIVSLPDSIEKIRLQIEVTNKTAADLRLQMYDITDEFQQVKLYLHDSDSLICNFMKDSLCLLPLTLEKEKLTLDLELTKQRVNFSTLDSDKVIFTQDNRNITVLQPERAEEIIITDMQGRQVSNAKGNNISLPYSGCFLMSVKSGSEYHSTKVMAP